MESDELLTIGAVAERAGVATSALRYYERRGLVPAPVRISGQRRYTQADLRRIVFIGMLQDAGLTLDDIDGILRARRVAEWKVIARERRSALHAEIEALEQMEALLDGALLCRFDHPLSECKIMGHEIDRRLAQPELSS